MSQRKSLIATAIFGVVIALALPACVVVPDQGHYAGGVVMVAPPTPRVEIAGSAPYAGYVCALAIGSVASAPCLSAHRAAGQLDAG
jgi:hypothetical protein